MYSNGNGTMNQRDGPEWRLGSIVPFSRKRSLRVVTTGPATASAFLGRMPGWRAFLFAEYAIHVEARSRSLRPSFESRGGKERAAARNSTWPGAACDDNDDDPPKTPRPHLDFYKTVARAAFCEFSTQATRSIQKVEPLAGYFRPVERRAVG